MTIYKFVLPIAIFFLIFDSCTQPEPFEKNFYEKISQIKLPDNYKVITTADNGEFVTITILDFNKTDCEKFYRDNNFKAIVDLYPPTLFGLPLLDSIYRKLPDKSRLLRNWGQKGKNNWTYLLDTANCRLYCEIGYPDWAGD